MSKLTKFKIKKKMSQLARALKFRRPSVLRRSLDTDSLTSLFFPWEQHHRHLNLTNIQTGRTVNSSEFYLFFASVLLLLLGLGQSILSIWSLASKFHLNYLADSSSELAHVILPSAILLFPSFWLTSSIHNDEKSQKYLPLVLLLLTFSISLTASGTYLGLTHRLRKNSEDATREFNSSMQIAQKFFKTNKKYKNAWNDVQTRFQCCGIDNSGDWQEVLGYVPDSCAGYKNKGCLRETLNYLVWQTSLFSGLNSVALVILCWAFVAVACIYFVNKKCKRTE